MLALTKRHHTEQIAKVSWHGGLYAVPMEIMDRYKIQSDNDNDNKNYIPISDLFSNLIQTSGEPGILLKGLRYREGLSQIAFAKQLHISQTNLSAIENGRRTIGKELAKRIADIFGVDYRIFL